MSGGSRCASTIQEFHSDIKALMNEADPDLPLFLYGQSMGGGLVLSLLI